MEDEFDEFEDIDPESISYLNSDADEELYEFDNFTLCIDVNMNYIQTEDNLFIFNSIDDFKKLNEDYCLLNEDNEILKIKELEYELIKDVLINKKS